MGAVQQDTVMAACRLGAPVQPGALCTSVQFLLVNPALTRVDPQVMLECLHSQIHYTSRIAYFFTTLHENIVARNVILVARQHITNVISRSFPLLTLLQQHA